MSVGNSTWIFKFIQLLSNPKCSVDCSPDLTGRFQEKNPTSRVLLGRLPCQNKDQSIVNTTNRSTGHRIFSYSPIAMYSGINFGETKMRQTHPCSDIKRLLIYFSPSGQMQSVL